MARRRNTTANRRTRTQTRSRSKQKESPGWVWAVMGLAVGLLISAFFWLSSVINPRIPIDPAPAVKAKTVAPKTSTPMAVVPKAIQKPVAVVTQQPVVNVPPAATDPKYDFYKLLPNQTVEVPTEHYRDKNSVVPVLQPQISSQEKSKKNSPTTANYFIQAGSFRIHKDADRRKAQLALIGVEARIQKVHVNDDSWHRVIIGPFKSRDQANRLSTRLHSEKIQTMLVNAEK